MKQVVLILSIVFFCDCTRGQNTVSFKPLRYDEDYSTLKVDSNSNWYQHLKKVSLPGNENSYLSFGGDIRYQYFSVQNEDWGDAGTDHDSYLLSRFLLHADIHAGRHFRTFVQLQSSLANGKSGTSPLDENPLELHQAFFDINIAPLHKNKITLRLGRQELAYGSQRLVSVREGPNNRQSFDGLKALLVSGNHKADLFFSHHVKAKKDLFDDGFNKDSKFWGMYLTKKAFPFLGNVDFYYLGLWKRNTQFDDGEGKELRHSFGSRIWSNQQPFKYDIEAVYQAGQFAAKDISAWTLSFNAAYKFTAPSLKPEIGLKTELISGDASYGDDKLGTFNPLFPRGGYFGLASLIGPANLFDIHPSLVLELHKKLQLNVDYDIFWRYSINDGIYTPGVSLIYTGKANRHKFIGRQLSADLVYAPNKHVYWRGEFTWFDAGDYLKNAGTGRDIFFGGITAQLKF
jgi:hypothetical protein